MSSSNTSAIKWLMALFVGLILGYSGWSGTTLIKHGEQLSKHGEQLSAGEARDALVVEHMRRVEEKLDMLLLRPYRP